MKILCTGDLHIGRRSSCVPELGHACSCAYAWTRVVDAALRERVNAVLLSGDLVDKDNRFFEAAGPLEDGIGRLAAAGVHTFAVAGNHDYAVLPQLLRGVQGDYLHLLGVDDGWECCETPVNGERLRVVGWSFPDRHVSSNPLDACDVQSSGTPTVGILHCDVDSSDGGYAPVPLADLRSRNAFCLWLLGHIHIPKVYERPGPLVINPGSPQAMEPGETGDHGPWIVEITGGIVTECRQLKMSTVKYCSFTIDVTDLSPDELRAKILEELRRRADDAGEGFPEPPTISCRLNIIGRTDLHSQLPDMLGELEKSPQDKIYVDQIAYDTTPALDLQSLASGKGAAAAAAQVLLSIEAGSLAVQHPDLLRRTEERLRQVYRAGAYQMIRRDGTQSSEDAPPDPDAITAILRAQCARLLAAMVDRGQDR